jgi:DNA-binding MarR family transcriptional regulator
VGVFHDIFRSSVHQLRPILQEQGVTMSQFLTLHVVSNLKVASVGEVAGRLGVSPPAVSVSVDPLEAAGLVSRRRSVRDARTVALVATPRGRKVDARIWARTAQVMASSVQGLSDADLATAVNVFEQIARRLEPDTAVHVARGL